MAIMEIISDYKHNGKGGQGTPTHVLSLPLPCAYSGEFNSGEAYATQAIDLISKEISKGNTPAAFIFEPISGCGGQVPLAAGYLKILSPFLRKNNILLIADEVQTGFGRLGKYFWGFEMHGIIPDLIVLGKPIANGHPAAAVVTTAGIAESFANGMEFFSSFGGNPVSCRVALEVLKIIKDEKLQENAKSVGEFLKSELISLKRQFASIGDVRGEGLFLGIEFIDDQGKPNKNLTQTISEKLKSKFILIGTDGPYENVLKLKPPLCFDKTDASFFINALEESLIQ